MEKLSHAAVSIRLPANTHCGALGPKSYKGSPVTIHLFVDDVDAVFDRAVKEGATPVMPVTDMFWGDRYGVLTDPFGHQWSVATHQRDLTPEQIHKGMLEACAAMA